MKQDFDWSSVEEPVDALENDQKYQEDIMNSYKSTFSNIKDKDIIKGKIVSILNQEVIVDIGSKSDGLIP